MTDDNRAQVITFGGPQGGSFVRHEYFKKVEKDYLLDLAEAVWLLRECRRYVNCLHVDGVDPFLARMKERGL